MGKKKFITIFWLLLIAVLGASFSLFYPTKKTTFSLAVIPHFMIQSHKVDEFYAFLKEKYYQTTMPDRIILLSPNHFFPEQKKLEGLCKTEKLYYKNDAITWYALNTDDIVCTWGVFYFRWEHKYIKDHGIWEHITWINKYFPNVQVVPLALPTHNMSISKSLAEKIALLQWNTFIIASVDFSHYKSEQEAKENDEISYATLSNTGSFVKLKSLDVDCPACLGVVYNLSEKTNQKIQQRYRDSSSTIVGYDLWKENTSRQFLYWTTSL